MLRRLKRRNPIERAMPTRDPSADSAPADADQSRNLPVPYVPPPRFGWLRRLMRKLGRGDSESLRESLEGALGTAHTEADMLSLKERTMLRNILELRNMRVDDVMVPRADIVAMEIETPIGEALQIFREAGHSRVPVYRETLDDPAGLVHIKDVMGHIVKRAEGRRSRRKTPQPNSLDLGKVDLAKTVAQTKLVREVLYVPPSMPALDLLAKMQTTRIHMGIVVDEYGGTDGLISIEDLVEMIVGDIEDEHDAPEGPLISARSANTYVADARVPLEDVAETLGADFEVGEVSEDVDTLGGLVFIEAGHIPVRGELIEFGNGFEFEVVEADPRRIKKILIHRRSRQAPTPPRPTRASPARHSRAKLDPSPAEDAPNRVEPAAKAESSAES